MKVCIAEKPSVAREIASILGANIKRDGFFEGNGYAVTYTFGHLCTLLEPSQSVFEDRVHFWNTITLGLKVEYSEPEPIHFENSVYSCNSQSIFENKVHF